MASKNATAPPQRHNKQNKLFDITVARRSSRRGVHAPFLVAAAHSLEASYAQGDKHLRCDKESVQETAAPSRGLPRVGYSRMRAFDFVVSVRCFGDTGSGILRHTQNIKKGLADVTVTDGIST